MSREKIDWRVAELLRARAGRCASHIDRPTDEYNYVKAGLVDSLSLLRFVLELEEALRIELTNDEIASPEFKTFGGLCQIIERKLP